MPTLHEKAAAFAAMHRGRDIIVLPNAWDSGSAVLMAEAGFPAIATTSAGVAFTQGLPDGQRIDRECMLALAGQIAAAVEVPVSADLEAGYGPRPEDVAATVRGAIAAGLVGCNIEDSSGVASRPLFDLPLAVLGFVRQALAEMRERGTFSYAAGALSNAEANRLMLSRAGRR